MSLEGQIQSITLIRLWYRSSAKSRVHQMCRDNRLLQARAERYTPLPNLSYGSLQNPMQSLSPNISIVLSLCCQLMPVPLCLPVPETRSIPPQHW